MNISRLFEMYFLYSMLEGTHIGHGSFFVNQLLSAAINSTNRIVNGILSFTPIVGLVGIAHNPNDRVFGYEMLALAAFKQTKLCMMEDGHMYWIDPRNRLMPFSNVDRTTLLNPAIFHLCLVIRS